VLNKHAFDDADIVVDHLPHNQTHMFVFEYKVVVKLPLKRVMKRRLLLMNYKRYPKMALISGKLK